jgi:hypothetical protein
MNAGGVPNACKSYAARFGGLRGARLRNTWVIYPGVGDNGPKGSLIPHTLLREESGDAHSDEPAAHQVAGRVRAYQADDGYLV